MTRPCDAHRCTHPGRYGLLAIATSESTLAAVGKDPFAAACGRHLTALVHATTRKGRTIGITDLTVKASA